LRFKNILDTKHTVNQRYAVSAISSVIH